jgi:hypothetical protein
MILSSVFFTNSLKIDGETDGITIHNLRRRFLRSRTNVPILHRLCHKFRGRTLSILPAATCGNEDPKDRTTRSIHQLYKTFIIKQSSRTISLMRRVTMIRTVLPLLVLLLLAIDNTYAWSFRKLDNPSYQWSGMSRWLEELFQSGSDK